MTNIAHALAGELERVVILREQYRQIAAGLDRTAASGFQPAIAMMTAAIDGAKLALGSDDALGTMRALADLQGFTE